MSVMRYPWTLLVTVTVLAVLGSEEYRTAFSARFPIWTKKVQFYTAANVQSREAMTTSEERLVFYNYPLAFNPAKARLALEEKSLKYTERRIDLFNGQSLEPWYMRLNPHGWSPTLVTGEEVLIESLDIIKWTDQQGSPLVGDTADSAFVSEWLSKVDAWDGNLFAVANSSAGGMFKFLTKFKIKTAEANAKRNPDLADLYMRKIASMTGSLQEADDTAKVEANKKQLVCLLDDADKRLGQSKYLAGDQYTAADVIFTPVIYRLFAVKKETEYLTSRINIKHYYEDIKRRPSYKTVFRVSDSGIATARTVMPALGKVLLTKLRGGTRA